MALVRIAIRIALAALLTLGFVAVASASPDDVLRDYDADGVVDGDYSVQDLSQALAVARAQGDALYADIAGAIEEARAAQLTGGRDEHGSGLPSKADALAGGGPSGADGGPIASLERPAAAPSALPVPPVAEPGADVPWPFVALSALAVLLALAGAASAAYRRLSR